MAHHFFSKGILCTFLLLLSFGSQAQHFYRLKADFSIKQLAVDGTPSLTIGTVYFDKNANQIVYKIHFPEPETRIQRDSSSLIFKSDTFFDSSTSFIDPKFSIFNLALAGSLENFGLEDGKSHSLKDVNVKGEKVISTWQPKPGIEKLMGKVLISQENKRMTGIIIFDPDEDIRGKQFYENYINVGGVDFPQKVIQFSYTKSDKSVSKQITTFKNIKINEAKEDHIYNYATSNRK